MNDEAIEHLNAALAGRYNVGAELGEGGMAKVYLADDLRHNRKVALKVLKPHLAALVGADRFLREIRTTANLQHPHVLPLHDSGEADGLLYYVMPYVEGGSVRDRLDDQSRLSVDECMSITEAVAGALDYAHRRGVVHRDIKPENILLQDGVAVLADFGIAFARDQAGAARLTETGMSLGTPAYMSPEQISADGGLDARSDVYSLACVVYEMLAGDPPFMGSPAAAVLARHVTDVAPPVTSVRPGVSRSTAGALARALAKTPADRFPTAAAFAAALMGDGEAAAVDHLSIAVLPFANLSPDPDNEYFADGLMEEVISDLSNVGSLKVISRNSAIQLKGTTKDTRTIGQELGVRYVVQGSVRRAGPRLRITTQLIDAEQDSNIWSEKYDGTIEDVFDLQEELSRKIVAALKIRLTPDEERSFAERTIPNVEAYEYYRRARFEFWKIADDSYDRGRRLALRSLELAGPNEHIYGLLGQFETMATLFGVPAEEAFARAEDWAQKAFGLNANSAQGHHVLSALAYRRGRGEEAIVHARRADELDPNDPESLLFLALSLMLRGRLREMRDALDRVSEVDPLNALPLGLSGLCALAAGDLERAVERTAHGLNVDAQCAACRMVQAMALAGLGREAEAQAHFRLLEEEKLLFNTAIVRLGMALRGDMKGARAALSHEERASILSDESLPYFMACALAVAGDVEESLDFLEHAIKDRGWVDYHFFGTHDRFLVSLRDVPRFKDLMAYARAEFEHNEG